MMNYSRICLAALVLLAGVQTSTAFAETQVEKSQRLYREHCRDCHDDGSANGEYTPMSLIQAQWQRFFDRKYERTHRKVMDETKGGIPVTEAISPEVLEQIQIFVIDHAADTDQPMTCG
jgi:hypothetical protein